ncbi:hypothetical protein [Agrococcus sp. KRD186]|uniref:hypothetical protein n=1 Tax=Agrococcus sp. KRD186 TaxID=2729730 RepID=UPI0019D19EC5|nr:hypothetical protein [Agrococcus sp. KRD186]
MFDFMAADDHAVEPLSVKTWNAFAAMVDRHNGIFGRCWSTYFHPECADRQPGAEAEPSPADAQ